MIVALLATSLAFGGITTDSPPVQGTATVVVLTDGDGRPRGGETVRVVHRPGLQGDREVAIGITDGLGRVRWTPDVAGVAEIRAGQEHLALQIGWPGIPLDSAVLLVLLGIAGLGAGGYGLGLGKRSR